MEHRLATRNQIELPADAFFPWLGMVRGQLRDISTDGAFFEGSVPDNVINDRVTIMVSAPGVQGQFGPIVAHIIRRVPGGVGVMFSEHHETTAVLVEKVLRLSRTLPDDPATLATLDRARNTRSG